MNFIDAHQLMMFIAAGWLLNLTPGPDVLYIVTNALRSGTRAGIVAGLGITAGCFVHIFAAAVGVGALLAASATAFTVLKIAGALYLLWLAVDAVRHGSALKVSVDRPASASFWRSFVLGVGINLTNPKVVLFFVTFLPQFVEAGDPHASGKLLFLGLYFVAFSAPLAALMILTAERVIALLHDRPRLLRAIDYGFAGLFSAFALRILVASR